MVETDCYKIDDKDIYPLILLDAPAIELKLFPPK